MDRTITKTVNGRS